MSKQADLIVLKQPHLPTADQVGMTAEWCLPVQRTELILHADFIGHATSQMPHHFGHDGARNAEVRRPCRACRWTELRIFREVPDPERYLVHTTGVSSIDGEINYFRAEWAFTAEEVVRTLATPVEDSTSRCPVCEGTGLVSRPPGVTSDQRTWGSNGVGPYPCNGCEGRGFVVITGAYRFTMLSNRVLVQAASFDEEINEVWSKHSRI